IETRFALGPLTRSLSRAAFATPADLYLAHSESALAVASDLLRSGKRVGVDMEDWYSEDLLPEDRRHRPHRLLRDLERDLLRRGAYAACPSHSMSEALTHEYGCIPPVVIYNAFPWSDRKALDGLSKDRRNRDRPSVHWF